MCGVVVDRAHDDAAGPGSNICQSRSFQFARFVAGFHILHFAVTPVGDPRGKHLQFAKGADGSDAAEFETAFAAELQDASSKVGKHK